MRVFIPATIPATWGQAMLVPVITIVAVLLPKALVDTILVPGAQMSMQSLRHQIPRQLRLNSKVKESNEGKAEGHYPKLEYGPILSLISRFPTAMTPGPAAGVTLQASVFPLPPATTTVIPA